MRKHTSFGLAVLVGTFVACGDDGSSPPTGTSAGAGNAGAAGASANGGANAGVAGKAASGAGGGATAGAAGTQTAGAAGTTTAGAAGTTTAGAAGSTAAGAAGATVAGQGGATAGASGGVAAGSGGVAGGVGGSAGNAAGFAGSAGDAAGNASGGNGGAKAGAGGGNAGQAGTTAGQAGAAGKPVSTNCKQHRACETGEALSRNCSLCTNQVCDVTPSCCDAVWDEACVKQAEATPVCDCQGPGGAGGSGGAAGGPPVVCHDACETGTRLDASCGTCAANVCAIDPFCCKNEWDEQCVLKAANVVEGCSCKPIEVCHSPCEGGGPLTIECDPCVADVCSAQPSCCESSWDATYCVALAKEACSVCQTGSGGSGGAAGGTGNPRKCPDNPCVAGGKATAQAVCNACIESVITQKPTCADGWKQGCADLAKATASCGCGQ